MNQFSAIYCINLDTRADRLEKVSKQISEYNVSVKFFTTTAHESPRMGCLESHLAVLTEARNLRLPNVLILEDDVVFLHKDVPRLPKQWDMLYLGGNIQEVYKTPWHADWKRVSTYTTHAYAVNCTLYDDLIDGIMAWKAAVRSGNIKYEDSAIDQYYATHVHPKHQCFMSDPIIATQDVDYSDIEKRKVNYEPFINNDRLTLARGERSLFMDDVFVINMFRRKDRIEALDRHFSELGIKYNRWNGVDGREYVPSADITALFKDNDFQYRGGVLGCALSHYELWSYLANSSILTRIAVFEDDIRLSPTFVKQWGSSCAEIVKLDSSWDFIYMGGCPPVKRPTNYIKSSVNIITPSPIVQMGLYSYCISRNGAIKLIQLARKNGIKRAIDWFATDNMKYLNSYQVWPSLTHSFSGIDSDTIHT